MAQREMSAAPENSLAAFVTSALPCKDNGNGHHNNDNGKLETNGDRLHNSLPTSNVSHVYAFCTVCWMGVGKTEKIEIHGEIGSNFPCPTC